MLPKQPVIQIVWAAPFDLCQATEHSGFLISGNPGGGPPRISNRSQSTDIHSILTTITLLLLFCRMKKERRKRSVANFCRYVPLVYHLPLHIICRSREIIALNKYRTKNTWLDRLPLTIQSSAYFHNENTLLTDLFLFLTIYKQYS